MNVTVRQATKEEWPVIQSLNGALFDASKSFDAYLRDDFQTSPEGEEYYKKAVTNPDYYTLIAEVDGTAVGYCIAYPKKVLYRTIRTLELDNLLVIPDYRSLGIGKRLLEELKAYAKAHGYQTIYVTAYAKNSRAVDFYEDQGFLPIDISLEHVL
jgi:ribosomal protein S18 acetylase RimI-like enzyme